MDGRSRWTDGMGSMTGRPDGQMDRWVARQDGQMDRWTAWQDGQTRWESGMNQMGKMRKRWTTDREHFFFFLFRFFPSFPNFIYYLIEFFIYPSLIVIFFDS
jgi:hypothetical protein